MCFKISSNSVLYLVYMQLKFCVSLLILYMKRINGLIMGKWQKSKSMKTMTTEIIMKYLSGKFKTRMKAK